MTESVEWSGDIKSAARTADVAIINAPYDHNINKLPEIVSGDYLSIEEGKEIFYGQFRGIERSSETGTITYNASDFMLHLLNSRGKYNFKNLSPEEITLMVCRDIGIETGQIAATGIVIPSMLCDSDSYYDIIMKAYTKAFKSNGIKYMCTIKNRKLEVVEKGNLVYGITLSDKVNLYNATISESMEAVINQVKIYDGKGNQIGEVRDELSIEKYGMFQENYTAESGDDPNTAAGNLLREPEQTLSIEAIGNINCTAGSAITVRDAATQMKGLYWIKSDRHTWQGGVHTMQLDLLYKDMMDEKDSGE